MDVHLIIFVLALVGVAESLYLNHERRRKRHPVCVIGHDCGKVWDSPRSKTFGVSNEIFGIIFYATVAVVEWSIFSGSASQSMIIGEYIILTGGTVMSAYFIYLQWRIIRAWCFWCTFSAIIVWTMVVSRLLF
ncbi:MAG: vitamin K epoxide reductase family protein [Minisyncoccia bacterium]